MQAQGYMQPIDREANLRQLYYDLAGNPTQEVVRTLLTVTTPDHILYGSDYPYLPDNVLQDNLKRLKYMLESDGILSRYADDMLRNNAEKLFNGSIDDNRK